MRPSPEHVRATFLHHHRHYHQQQGENFNRELSSERSTVLSYSGRTVYELLQNALDRAEKSVVLALLPGDPPCLVVGNDGCGLTIDHAFDYDPEDLSGWRSRSDFHSLCSLHTSNKKPDESIGNKGLGFRSVFSLGRRVQVWSRLADLDSPWWGLELNAEFTGATAPHRESAEPAVREGLLWLGPTTLPKTADRRHRPSFYFPLPLRSSSAPIPALDTAPIETLVVVPLQLPGSVEQVRGTLAELRQTHLYFVGLRPGKEAISVTLRGEDGVVEQIPVRWTGRDSHVHSLASWRPSKDGHPLAAQAKAARHEISRPGVALAWPPPPGEDGAKAMPLLYSYLPTRIPAPIRADIHADFQLEANRTSLNHDPKDPVGAYNRSLLEAAAELHLIMVLRHAGLMDEEIVKFPAQGFKHLRELPARDGAAAGEARPDLFTCLCPRIDPDLDHPFIGHLERLLFDDALEWTDSRAFKPWARLALLHFGTDRNMNRSLVAYDAFWAASSAWLRRTGRERANAFGWKQRRIQQSAVAMGEALRQSGACVVPLVDQIEARENELAVGFPLPERRDRGEGGRLERRLFVRQAEEAGANNRIHVPRVVRARGRAVTSYTFGNDFPAAVDKALGTTAFSRWELLVDLRQLPARLGHQIDGRGALLDHTARQSAADNPFHPGSMDPADQLDLLRFAAELFVRSFGASDPPQSSRQRYEWGWRVDAGLPELQQRAGRALATLFVRTVEEAFEPARQLDLDRVDLAWLAPIQQQVEGLDLTAFLLFLGVSPVRGLQLVEQGTEGLVQARPHPPMLADADGASGAVDLVVRESDQAHMADMLSAWPHLRRALDAETAGRKTRIAETLGAFRLVPRSTTGLQLPFGLNQAPEMIAPHDIVLFRPGPEDRRRRVLVFGLEVGDEPLRELLFALGAIPGLDEQALQRDEARAALRLLVQLKALDLSALAAQPAARQALVELFQNILDAVARHAPRDTLPLPLLIYSPCPQERTLAERTLRWVGAGDRAFIAKDNSDREWIRRLFHGEPLVTATLRPEIVAKLPSLRDRAVVLHEHIRFTHAVSSAISVRTKLEALMPGLLALAEVSRLSGGIKIDEATSRWMDVEIRQVENVWYEFELQAGRRVSLKTWLEDTRGDVIRDGCTILFDVNEGQGHPPLRAFARALAEAVVGNASVAGTFALALAEFDAVGEQGFQAHLHKEGAARLAETYARELRPTNPPLPGETEAAAPAQLPAELPTSSPGVQLPIIYREVTQLEDGARSWRVRSLGAARECEERAPQSAEDRHREDDRKSAIGAASETAFLSWVVCSTQEALRKGGDRAWAILLAAPYGESLGQYLRAAQQAGLDRPDLLKAALHISIYHGAAGFDLIGLESDGDDYILTCYECKALPTSTQARIHLSRNQVGEFRRCATEPARGRWKLICVSTEGPAQDMTDRLKPLIERDGPLDMLNKQGLDFDTVTLTIDRVAQT